MADYKDLKARLDRGETIIHDAAVSTELQSMGIPMDFIAWSGPTNYTHPSSVIQMHERHIRAGSDIITTNTWSTLRPTLERAGYGDFVREINVRAVHLAQEARERASNGRDIWIAGSLSNHISGRDPRTGEIGFGAFSATPQVPLAELEHYYRESTNIMAEAGVDFFVVEAMGRDNEARMIQAKAAKETGLPVWIGFNAYINSTDTVMAGGQQNPTDVAEGIQYLGSRPMKDLTLSEAVREAIQIGPDVISIFHTRIPTADRAVDVVMENWQGSVMVYPDAGRKGGVSGKWYDHSANNEESVEEYVDAAKVWIDKGVQIVGACCGFGVDYIKPLRQIIPKKV